MNCPHNFDKASKLLREECEDCKKPCLRENEKAIACNQLDKIMKEIQRLEADTVMNFLDLGRNWSEVRNLLKFANTPAHNFKEFVESQCQRTWQTVYGWIYLHEKYNNYIQYLKGKSIDYRKLLACAPYITDENAEEWIYRAYSNNRKDFDDFIREAKGQIATDTCQHIETDMYTVIKCRKCGKTVSYEKQI